MGLLEQIENENYNKISPCFERNKYSCKRQHLYNRVIGKLRRVHVLNSVFVSLIRFKKITRCSWLTPAIHSITSEHARERV